ncbi:FG-GAP-like repeat-containing protein [Streptomyces sp. NPDC049597]|uniref:FG-GAP-like repeat-containing protein n=1 Tax=Streptomyces sp. NPDC049597 TaxID=3155276 RepID=UPI0034489062
MAAATLVAGVGPFALTATAAEGSGVVFPAAAAPQPRTVVPLVAGPTGYLRYEQGVGHFWSTYAGDSSPISTSQEGPEADGTYGAGFDGFASYMDNPGSMPDEVRLVNMATDSVSRLTIPSGHEYIGAFGSTVVTFTRATSTAPRAWHLLRLVNGSVQVTPVTGWPEGAQPPARAVTGGADGILATYEVGGVSRSAWVDLASAQVRTVPADATVAPVSTVQGPTEIVEWAKDGKARFYAKGGADAPGPLTLTGTADLPYNEGDVLLGVVGDRLIVGRASGQASSAPYRVVSVPRTGGDETTLFTHGRGQVMAAPDGGLLLIAGAAADALGVQRLRAEGDGTTAAELVDVTPLTSKPRSFTFSHGQLHSLERMPDETNSYRSRTVSVTGELTAGTTVERGDFGFPLQECDTNGCPEPLATGDGRMVVQPPYGSQLDPLVVEQGATSGRVLTGEVTNVQIYDVSGRYAIGSGRTQTGEWVTNTAFDLDTGKRLATFEVPFDYDLYGDTLWTQGKVNGTVVGYDVRTGAVKRTMDLGTGCRAEFLKVTAHWLSWTCAGTPDRGGIHDLDKNTNRNYTEPFSQLGDGYVVQGEGREVRVIDVRGPEPVLKETYLTSDDNFESGLYTIDTAAGRVAYQENAAGDIRVADLGIPASPLARIDSDVATGANLKAGAWKPRWWLSKPAASWTLTLTHKATGTVARTLTGGEARGVVSPVWDGKDANGRLVGNGAYSWSLSVKPADGQGADLTEAGAVAVTGAAPVWRDLVGDDGFGDLLVMDSTGLVSLYKGTGTGGLSSRIAGTGTKFATTAVLVPFGDVNGDRCNDVLVRAGNELRAYRQGCGKVVSASSPYTSVGTGWGQYDVLTSPGDVNADGYADLIARQATTGDMYFYAGTADHRFKGRVKIGTNWKTYAKIVGAGDLNGDGRGDLLGVDQAGVLWRYYGTATGGVTPRVKLATGWGGYTSVVGVGDIGGDGKPDLLGRTGDGRLYRHSATGSGTLAARVLIGTGGWQAFKGLY